MFLDFRTDLLRLRLQFHLIELIAYRQLSFQSRIEFTKATVTGLQVN